MSHPKVLIKMGVERVSVSEAARRAGISPTCLWHRLKQGVSREKLLAPGYGARKVPAPEIVACEVVEQPKRTMTRHPFEFFRVGQDVCWRCGKTKREHHE